MGKQAKKKVKTESQAKGQRVHNPKTRGINTRRAGAVWSRTRYRTKDEDGNEVTRVKEVRIPHGTMWDPFDKVRYSENPPEPFDTLQLDENEEFMEYALRIGAKYGSIKQENGTFLHRVYEGGSVEEPRVVHLEMVSGRPLIIDNRGLKRRARRKKA